MQQQEEEAEAEEVGEGEVTTEIPIDPVLQEMLHPETGVIAQEAGVRVAGA